MRVLPSLVAAVIVASASPAALALPRVTIPGVAAPHLLPVKHRWHRGYWRYYGYRYAPYDTPYYGLQSQTQAAGEPYPAYPPAIGSSQPSATTPAPTLPEPNPPKTPPARPRIEWVNPDRPTR